MQSELHATLAQRLAERDRNREAEVLSASLALHRAGFVSEELSRLLSVAASAEAGERSGRLARMSDHVACAAEALKRLAGVRT